MLRIRRMRMEDIPFAIRLSDREHWGVTRSDLNRLLRISPSGCFLAYDGARKVGLTTATAYGKTLGWIGNVVVDKEHRRLHIGRSLVEHAIDFLERSKIRNIALYCFREHVPFYENLGFVKDAQFVRMSRKARSNILRESPVDFGPTPSLKDLVRADMRAFGADRSRLLRDALARKAAWYVGSTRSGEGLSYLMVREYRDTCEIGPWVCINPPRNEPEEILCLALREVGELSIEVSCLQRNRHALQLMQENKFRILRGGYRMFLGKKSRVGDDRAQYALGFLDKG